MHLCLIVLDDFLIEDPTLMNAPGVHGIPLFYFPIILSGKIVAEYLPSRGADPRAASADGITPPSRFSNVQSARYGPVIVTARCQSYPQI